MRFLTLVILFGALAGCAHKKCEQRWGDRWDAPCEKEGAR
jgi:hypothetical protein